MGGFADHGSFTMQDNIVTPYSTLLNNAVAGTVTDANTAGVTLVPAG